MTTAAAVCAGDLLKQWRARRRISQLELACEAGISTRHLSFMETGRSNPSREMLLRLAEHLQLPLRARNELLLAAGFAPAYSAKPLEDATIAAARQALDLVLQGHEPWPALVVDRHWNLIAANRGVEPLLAGTSAKLLEPPINVLRLSLHPDGVARRIMNLAEWRSHILERLRRQVEVTGDAVLSDLLEELEHYPVAAAADLSEKDPYGFVVPLRLSSEVGVLNLFSTTTVFGTPLDVTLSEIAIESFFPADEETAENLRRLVLSGKSGHPAP